MTLTVMILPTLVRGGPGRGHFPPAVPMFLAAFSPACIVFLLSFVGFVIVNNALICSKADVRCKDDPDKIEKGDLK